MRYSTASRAPRVRVLRAVHRSGSELSNYLFWPRDSEAQETVPVASNAPGDSSA